jgi:hypothetical protein
MWCGMPPKGLEFIYLCQIVLFVCLGIGRYDWWYCSMLSSIIADCDLH